MYWDNPIAIRIASGIGVGFCCFFLPWMACKDNADPSARGPSDNKSSQTETSKQPSLAPAQLIAQLREYHRLRQYHRIEDNVAPDRRDDLTKLLSAVDRILVANEQAIQIIRQSHSVAFSGRWDIAAVADSLGIFSQHLNPIDTTYTNGRAVVHYQVADKLPLRKATFIRHNGRWLYQPDTIPGLAELVDELAGALDILVATLDDKPLSEKQIESAYKNRILPIIQRMDNLAPLETGPPTGPAE